MMRISTLAALLTLSLSLTAFSQPPEAPTSGVDKASLEAYLRDRSERIKQMHKSRVDFMTEESEVWNAFWNKTKDDRLLFEVRVIRQRLDLFESLASLESRDHAPSITDFEKLQANVIKAFEAQQKQRMADFFSERDARSKSFAVQQEKDRLESVSDADKAWQGQKAGLRGQPAPESKSGRR